MSSNRRGFGSLSDAGGLLRDLKRKLSEERKQVEQGAQIRKVRAEASPADDLERQMAKKDRAIRASEKSAKKAKRGKAHKAIKAARTILRGPGIRAAYNEHLASEQAARAARETAKVEAAISPVIERRLIFERITELVGRSTPEIEQRPEVVSDDTAAMIELLIERGANEFAAAPEPDLEGGFIVGFDFGTSSLKLAVRQPYKAGDPLAVLPVYEEIRSGGHPHLWQTVLWFDPADESFSLVPKTGAVALEGFKTGIIGGFGGQRVREDLPVNRNEAAAAFVALQLAHFFGWYHENKPLREGGDRFLSINIGIPVAAQDDTRAFANFRRIIATARTLIPRAPTLSLELVRTTFNSSPDQLPAGWEVIPELTAAIAGYAASTDKRAGSHVLVDVGASTLDIVAFNLVPGERIAVISAAVELLGSASLRFARANDVSDEDFLRACDEQFERVFLRQACKYERGGNGFSPTRRRHPVQLVTTGGGCATEVHKPFIATMPVDGVLGDLPIVRPLPQSNETMDACDQARLLLAFGLTRDVQELLDLKLPSQVADISRPPPPSDPFVGAEMT